MLPFLLWYLTISLAGWLVFPLAYRLLPGLADRGLAFSRALGWLLWGYVFWLLSSLGVVHNDLGGLLFAFLILLVLSAWALRETGLRPALGTGRRPALGTGWGELSAWLRSQRRLVLAVEALFLLAFAGWAAVRAANPDIFGTEKPMELAFINAILRSPSFPPHDPWLSGYAISYYYFGYVLVAMLARVTGVTGSVAFNLGIALVFALSALGAYGIVYNLLEGRKTKDEGRRTKDERSPSSSVVRPSSGVALLGPLFVLLVSNLEGFLEVLHARGLFSASFWRWLDILDINQAPAPPFSWLPRLYGTGNWWWWRASRVLHDYDFQGNSIEIIDEFPFFSYLLADLHPHVLAMPFAFLAMALALNLLSGGSRGFLGAFRRRVSLRALALTGGILVVAGMILLYAGISGLSMRLGLLGVLGFVAGGFMFARVQTVSGENGRGSLERVIEVGQSFYLDGPAFLLSAVVLGGLAFLNTWDFPFYVALFAAAYAIRRMKDEGGRMNAEGDQLILHPSSFILLFKDFLALAIAVGVAGILLYLPFYLGFSSQANGILPNLIHPTRGAHLWVMFAVFLLPLLAYLAFLWRRSRASAQVFKGLAIAFGLTLLLWVLSLLFALGITTLPNLGDLFLGRLGAPNGSELIQEAIIRRLAAPGAWLTLAALLGVTIGLILKGIRGIGEKGNRGDESRSPTPLFPYSPDIFALLLILLGTLLLLGPEFFFLLDQFGSRMNTIFKFYYQAWLLLGVAAAYSSAVLVRELRRGGSFLFSAGLVLLLGMGLTYTVLALWDKTEGFDPTYGWTLDGADYIERQAPDEMAAVRWLRSAPPGVLAEATAPDASYKTYSRVSMLSGQPALLGWPGHESQWRGGGSEMGSRLPDLERLYCSRGWEETQAIIDQYDIRYIYVGSLERTTYIPGTGSCASGLNQAKLDRNLNLVFQEGGVLVYEVPQLTDPAAAGRLPGIPALDESSAGRE